MMALRFGALQDALLDAGASPERAQKAAEEAVSYEMRMSSLDTKVSVLTWMVATLITLQIALGVGNLWLSFNILSRLPR
jgi:hypothetical protein